MQKQVEIYLILLIIQLLGIVKRTQIQLTHYISKQMNNILKVTTIGMPAVLGLGIALFINRIIRNEKELKIRELELQRQLNKKSIKSFQ